ncbi:MAG: M10 family metallopeptidase C-terminal domain-containing protein, partial [Allosphingosinicella sp.]
MLPTGGFVATFGVLHGQIFAQRFDASGAKLGDAILVTPPGPSFPEDWGGAVAVLASGDLVVTWTRDVEGSGTRDFDIYARRFDSNGAPIGSEFVVNSVKPSIQFDSSITALASGGFVITWDNPDDSIFDIKAQIYNADGIKVGGEFQINHVARSAQGSAVVALPGGGFVVTWTERTDEDFGNVKAQIFTDAGLKVGPDILVNTITDDGQFRGGIEALPWGGFIVTWSDSSEQGGDDDVYGIMAQVFDSGGGKVGGPFLVNTSTVGDQTGPAVAGLPSGELVIVWTDDDLRSADSFDSEVRAQFFRPLDDGDDIITGDDRPNILDGGEGNDTITARGGNDKLGGEGGNDLLDGGAGADSMAGGTGNDVYFVDHVGDSVVENFLEGTDEIRTTLATYSLVPLFDFEILTAASDAAHDFRGNSRNNVLVGGGGADILRLYDGGSDIVNAGAGDDSIFFGGTLSAADRVNGGDGTDTLVLQGSYGALALTSNVTLIENISLLAGGNTNFGEPGTNLYDYVITTHDSNFAAGVQARINGSALLAGEDFTFNGSAETNASFVVSGGRGQDSLTGGFGNDIFFFAEDQFAAGDRVNGGPGGYDGMFLRGSYTIDFTAPGYTGLFTSIENLTLSSATDERYARGGTEFDYNIILSNALVAAGAVLTVSGTILGATETMILDGSQESDGVLRLFGGKANDTLKGGGQADLIHGNLGADTLAGGGGADMFRYDSIAESTSASRDQILDFTPGTDKIDLSRIDARTNLAGDQAFIWIGSTAFSGNTA